jgi:hypothetical protein
MRGGMRLVACQLPGGNFLERFVFPILVAIVIAIITDIDTPRAGLISLDERPLLELNETLRGSSTSTTP